MSTTTVDPKILTIRQGKTFRVTFQMTTSGATPTPISLAGYGARFQVLSRVGGTVLITVDDTTFDPGNPADKSVYVEPGGATPAIGQIQIRLGADQTALLTRNCAYDCGIYLKSDPNTEIEPICSGPVVLLKLGAE